MYPLFSPATMRVISVSAEVEVASPLLPAVQVANQLPHVPPPVASFLFVSAYN